MTSWPCTVTEHMKGKGNKAIAGEFFGKGAAEFKMQQG